jgi:hypothetical protein
MSFAIPATESNSPHILSGIGCDFSLYIDDPAFGPVFQHIDGTISSFC